MDYSWFANDPKSYEAMTLRQKIALAHMMQKSAYPKNLGEGFASVGKSLGDAFMMRNMERQAAVMREKDALAAKAAGAGYEQGADASEIIGAPLKTADAAPVTPPKPPDIAEVPPGNLPQQPQPPTRSVSVDAVRYPEPTPPGPATGPSMLTQPPPEQRLATNMVTPPGQPPFPDPDKALEEPPGPGTSFNDRFAGEPTFGNAYGTSSGSRLGAMGWLPDAQQANASMAPPPAGEPPPPQVASAPPPGPMTRGPQLAARGDLPVQNDAGPVGVIGAGAGEGVKRSITDILMQRDGQPPPGPQPAPPPGPQMAQAGPGVFPQPTMDASGRPAAILPGGGFPPTPPPIQPAPPDPRGVIRAAPRAAEPAPDYEPEDRPMPQPPRKPGPGPYEIKHRGYETRDIGPQERGMIDTVVKEERNRRNAVYENQLKVHEVERSDWLKLQEQRRDYMRHRNYEKNRGVKEGGQAVQEVAKGNRIEQQLDTEQQQREAQLQKQIAEGGTAAENFAFLKRTGQEREPFIKDFKGRRDEAVKSVALQKNFLLAKEAANSGFLISGKGANLAIDLAKMGAALNIKDSKQLAYTAEMYQRAIDGTVTYGASLLQPGDSRMTEADLAASRGLTGSPELQLRSKQKLIDIALEDQHRKLTEYEDLREQYFRGDPSHRFLKVDAPPIGKGTRKILLENMEDPEAVAEFDRLYGPGAARLEISRAKRRQGRADKALKEDD